jgi:1,4-alpha-glucan branching enzyme
VKKETRKRVEFKLKAEPGRRVSVTGTFNDWDPEKNPMKDNPDSGHYKATLLLPPGRYEYKFVVNGEWLVDANCPECVANGIGSSNSVLCVQGPKGGRGAS